MGRAPFVSIIMAAYNSEAYVEEALRSVKAQTYPHIELIFVDDGSTDETLGRARRAFPHGRFVSASHAGGYVSKQRNRGIREAQGEYLSFFDADDIMLADKIENQVRALEKYREVDAVFGDYRNFQGDQLWGKSHFQSCSILWKKLQEKGQDFLRLMPDESSSILLRENFSSTNNSLLRRGVLSKTGLWDEELKSSEDYEFFYRVVSAGPIGVMNEVGFHRRLHPDCVSFRTERRLASAFLSRKKILLREKHPFHRKLLKSTLAVYSQQLAEFYLETDKTKVRDYLIKAFRYNPFSIGRSSKTVIKMIPYMSIMVRHLRRWKKKPGKSAM